tara:strand:+ start:12113 stop:12277 length:165 start_codon:yes stop_codon:yes gene_type:complete
MKIEDTDLHIRIKSCLKNEGMVDIEETIEKTDAELLRIPNFGRWSLHKVREAAG